MATYTELDKDLTSDEASLKQEVHRFSADVLRPASIELDRMEPAQVIAEGSPLWDVFRQAYELGYHTRSLPPALGGVELSPIGRHIFAEEMGWGSADFAIALGVTAFPFSFAAMGGNPEIIADIVKPYSEDRLGKFVGCWAITEPDHGSDAVYVGNTDMRAPDTAFSMRARADGDEWVISGQKSAWVSNGTIATHALAFLSMGGADGSEGGCVALIPLDLPGVSKGEALNKIGQRALNQGELFFDDVRIPKHYMLVEPQAYPFLIDSVLSGANAGMGATFTGLARAAFEESLNYARHRVQGGRPICEHQAIQLKLMDMFIKVETARSISRAAMAYNSTTMPPKLEYSVTSKVYCTQAAFDIANDGIQIFGGLGLTKETLIEKLFRDARAALIEDGTNEVLSLAGARKIIDGYQTGS